MRLKRFTIPASLALMAGCLCGCGQKGQSVSLDKMARKAFGPSNKELVAMAFDPDDPDRRREGISRLSNKKWGRREPHLSGYAVVLRNDEDASVRSAAVRALSRSGDPKYLPDIVAALSDPSDSVRWDAAAALDELPGEAAIEPLRRHAMDDTFGDVRMTCAKALRHYRRREVVRTLTRCLADPSFGVRHQAHASLVELTGRDYGFEMSHWSEVIKTFDPNTKLPDNTSPWWDWFGVKNKESPSVARERPVRGAVDKED